MIDDLDGIKSLGWALLDWLEAYIPIPDGDRAGEPFVPVGWQLDWWVRWFAVDDGGRWLFRRSAMQMAKGAGKSPLAAAWALAELCGPAQFDGWDAAGEPVGRPVASPWVQIAALSLDQTDNTYLCAYQMGQSDSFVDDHRVEVGRTRFLLPGGRGWLEPVTAEAGSREGQRLTAAVADETHWWTPRNGGRRLAETLRRNLAKTGGRLVETTNAYEPGVGTVAEATHRAAEKGSGIFFLWHRSKLVVDDPKNPDQLRPALVDVYDGCPWVDVDRIVDDAMDDDVPVLSIRRFNLNEVVAHESRLVKDELLESRLVADVEIDEPITLGFDGSKSRDATALVAVGMESGTCWQIGVWQRPPFIARGQWEVPRQQVMDVLSAAFNRCTVVALLADPSWWLEELQTVKREHPDQVEFFRVNSHTKVHESIQAVQAGFESGTLRVDASAESVDLRDHLRAATVTLSAAQRMALVKPDDGRLFDAAQALVYAWWARVRLLAEGWEPPAPVEPFVFFGSN